MVKRWGQTDKQKPRYGCLDILGAIDTQNSAEGPKCSQNEPFLSHIECINILTRIVQMRNGEEMWSNG
jgi:hypothetical protein